MPMLCVDNTTTIPVELYYEVHGSGKPIVLIHGWPLSGRAWEKQIPALTQAGFQVITYDRRGFGKSSQPDFGYDYDTLAADLNSLLEQLDLNDAILLGFSMGGGEVARYIGKYGTERVEKAVLAAAVPPYLYKADDNPDGGLDDATIKDFLDGVRGDRLDFLQGFSQNFFSNGSDEPLISEALRQYHCQIAAFASPKATYECIKSFSYTDFRDDLKKITVPTLILHGDSDAIVPIEVSGQRAHDSLAQSTLYVIKGGPHGVNTTHPDEFNQALLDFLQR